MGVLLADERRRNMGAREKVKTWPPVEEERMVAYLDGEWKPAWKREEEARHARISRMLRLAEGAGIVPPDPEEMTGSKGRRVKT